MKRFSFSLDRVLGVRRHELEAAEARLHSIQARQAQTRRRADSLEQQFFAFGDASLGVRSTTGRELRAGESYLEHLHRERLSQLEEERKAESERQLEVRRVLEARRKVKLLEKLRRSREQQHRAETARELESQAAEIHLAKWIRERREHSQPENGDPSPSSKFPSSSPSPGR